MRHVLAVLTVAGLVAPVYAMTDYFPVTGDGSFDTYHNSSGTATNGYTNNGSGSSARLGYMKDAHGWLSWDAKNPAAVQHTSVGDVTGRTLSQFLAANPSAKAS